MASAQNDVASSDSEVASDAPQPSLLSQVEAACKAENFSRVKTITGKNRENLGFYKSNISMGKQDFGGASGLPPNKKTIKAEGAAESPEVWPDSFCWQDQRIRRRF